MSKHDEFPTKPDYEAKYKALEQAVKDALSEMVAFEYKHSRISNNCDEDMARGAELCIDILTEKTGIKA